MGWADLTEEQRRAQMQAIEQQQAAEQQAKADQMRAIERKQFEDEMAQGPKYPGFDSLLDDSGNIKGQYRVDAGGPLSFYSNIDELKQRGTTSQQNLDNRLAGIQLNKEGLTELRKRGLATGPSAWAGIAEQQQRLGEATNRDRAASQAMSAKESAYSDLASQGGLSAGARERLARNSQRDLASTRQDVAREGAGQRLGISSQDESNKIDILKQLPGMEVQALQPDFEKTRMQTGLESENNSAWRQLAESEASRRQAQDQAQREREMQANQFNISNAINQNTYKNAANLNNYGEQMKQYAAFKQSKAMGPQGEFGVKEKAAYMSPSSGKMQSMGSKG